MTGRFKLPMWIVPLLIAGLVAVFGWWGNAQLREIIEGGLKAELTARLNANVISLEIWTTNQMRLASSLADQPEVRTLATTAFEEFFKPVTVVRPPAGRTASDQFGNYLRPSIGKLGYDVAQLVSTNYQVIAQFSRSNFFGGSNIGRGRPGIPIVIPEANTNKFAELFASGGPVIITPFKPEPRGGGFPQRGRPGGSSTNLPPGFRQRGGTNDSQRGGAATANANRGRRGDGTLMQVAAPLRDTNNILRGALALVITPDKEFTKVLSASQLGKSGETYAFDQTGLMISRSRFDEQLHQIGLLATNTSSALNLRLHDPGGDLTKGFKRDAAETNTLPLTKIVANAVTDEDGLDIEPSRDYRGVPVVGAWKWLPQFGFGIATQIDADEAYRPLRVLKVVFTMLSLLLVLCATGMFLFSYANVAWRKRLGEAELKLKQLGQYQLEEKIGEGGMGVVYRARHALMRRDTAIKLLMPDRANETSIARFEREVVLTCQLTHPNTIQVYDYGHTPEGIFYFAMEYLRGLNLHELVARFGTPPEGRVIHILTQVCDSLAEAHAMGLVHRDIKPANVFLCDRGGIPDSVKVLDFGLVREYSGANPGKMHLTGEDGIVGTPLFMAPEAIKNSSSSNPVSDIYSVGALAYYLLTSHYVFFGESAIEIHEQQLTTTPVPPNKRSAVPISAELEKAILRCLNRDPGLRPQSVSELRQQLLTSPRASDWTLKMQTDWWANYRVQESQTSSNTVTATASPIPTVKIDFASRMS